MALTHHVIVQLASLKVSGKKTDKYCLLGDDIVIWDDDLARGYLEMLKSLDMPISEQKTHISSSTYEFCKRWFINGIEVTGFSVPGL